MSKTINYYIDGSFEFRGEIYKLVNPSSFHELMKALKVKEEIGEILKEIDGEDLDKVLSILEDQNDMIYGYVDDLKEFDNSLFINNLDYLLKESGLKTGELEDLINVSAGYISRTAKKNSKKRMSIDVIWDIATLFEIDIKSLLETDLRVKNTNNSLIIKFIQKIRRQVETHEVTVEMYGGNTCFLNDKIHEAGIVHEIPGGFLYHPERLTTKKELLLADDILGIPNFKDDKALILIPFKEEGWENYSYELLMLDKDSKIESIFCTIEAPFEDLQLYAKLLYDEMREQEFDVSINPEIKKMINDYLSDK